MKLHEFALYNLLLLSAVACLFCLAVVALGSASTAHKVVLTVSALITIALTIWANRRNTR